jgi:hypothetical protein
MYPDTAEPPESAASVHERLMLSVVCPVPERSLTAAGDVDAANVELLSPSPETLKALTANTYSWPPESPLTLHAATVEPVPSHATVESSDPPAPSFRYTMYPVTADPVDTAGPVQTRSIPPVLKLALASPIGADGLVEAAAADALRSPSPAALTAPTTYTYSTPPLSPDRTQ